MNADIKRIQGIKRPYDLTPSQTAAGYQPVAKKTKGKHFFTVHRCSSTVDFSIVFRYSSRWYNSSRIDAHSSKIFGTLRRRQSKSKLSVFGHDQSVKFHLFS